MAGRQQIPQTVKPKCHAQSLAPRILGKGFCKEIRLNLMWSLLNCIIFVASWNVHSHEDTKVENKEYFCCLQTIQICFSDKKTEWNFASGIDWPGARKLFSANKRKGLSAVGTTTKWPAFLRESVS